MEWIAYFVSRIVIKDARRRYAHTRGVSAPVQCAYEGRHSCENIVHIHICVHCGHIAGLTQLKVDNEQQRHENTILRFIYANKIKINWSLQQCCKWIWAWKFWTSLSKHTDNYTVDGVVGFFFFSIPNGGLYLALNGI